MQSAFLFFKHAKYAIYIHKNEEQEVPYSPLCIERTQSEIFVDPFYCIAES